MRDFEFRRPSYAAVGIRSGGRGRERKDRAEASGKWISKGGKTRKKRKKTHLVQHFDVAPSTEHLLADLDHPFALAHMALQPHVLLPRKIRQPFEQFERAGRNEAWCDDRFDDLLVWREVRDEGAHFGDEGAGGGEGGGDRLGVERRGELVHRYLADLTSQTRRKEGAREDEAANKALGRKKGGQRERRTWLRRKSSRKRSPPSSRSPASVEPVVRRLASRMLGPSRLELRRGRCTCSAVGGTG
jgi:hypothetical protein